MIPGPVIMALEMVRFGPVEDVWCPTCLLSTAQRQRFARCRSHETVMGLGEDG